MKYDSWLRKSVSSAMRSNLTRPSAHRWRRAAHVQTTEGGENEIRTHGNPNGTVHVRTVVAIHHAVAQSVPVKEDAVEHKKEKT